jgi:hypothetical protein
VDTQFADALKKTFGTKTPLPEPAPPPEPPIIQGTPIKLPPLPEVKLPEEPKKTVKDIRISAEAQRIYNPQMPPVPPKAPPAKMVGQGIAPAMDLTGAWGKPNV